MEESLVLKAFNRWRNKINPNLYRQQLIFKSKNGESIGEISGEGLIFNGTHKDREQEWMDYICLRDNIDYRKRDKPALTEEHFSLLKVQVLEQSQYGYMN